MLAFGHGAPFPHLQAYTAGRDGTLRLWNYLTQECVRVLHVRETARSMVSDRDDTGVQLPQESTWWVSAMHASQSV